MTANISQNSIYTLKPLIQPGDKTEAIADQIITRLGPQEEISRKYYLLIASRIPEDWIYRNVSEILNDPKTRHPGSILKYRAKQYAADFLDSQKGEISAGLNDLADRFKIT